MIEKAGRLWREGSKAYKKGGWLGVGKWIIRKIVSGIKQIPLVGPMVEKAQRLWREGSKAYKRGGWLGVGKWVVNKIVQGIRQTALVRWLTDKARRLWREGQAAFKKDGWLGVGRWVVQKIVKGLKEIPVVGPLIEKAERLYNEAKAKVESQGWFGLGADIVNKIIDGLKSVPIIGGLIEQFESIKNWWIEVRDSGFWQAMGQSIFGGLAQGAGENGQSFVDTIGRYMDEAINAVSSRVQPSSPSKVGRFYGANLMEGLTAGVESQGQMAVRAVDNNMARMVASVHRGADAMRNTRMDLPAAHAQAMAQINARRAEAARMQEAPHRSPRTVQTSPMGQSQQASLDRKEVSLNVHVTSDGNGGVNVRELEGSIYDIVEDVLGGYG
jgi:hypothetical protein